MAAVTPPRPLTEIDDRALFDCERDSVNAWFRKHAWFNHVNDISRVNVIADVASGRIAGYVTLSAGQIERAFLVKAMQRNRPELECTLVVRHGYSGDRAISLLGLGFRDWSRSASNSAGGLYSSAE